MRQLSAIEIQIAVGGASAAAGNFPAMRAGASHQAHPLLPAKPPIVGSPLAAPTNI
jgi:hypothetical protein